MTRILVVDDDPHARDLLQRLLGPLGDVETASGPAQAEAAITKGPAFDLVMTDMAMPDAGDGLKVLTLSRTQMPETPVVVVTAYGNIEGALDTIESGAFDYLPKPFDVDAIVRIARRALEQKRLVEENRTLRQNVKPSTLVGRSAAVLEVFKQVARAAPSMVPVLITGETGTGKEMVARALHQRSQRAGPFVPVDCAVITESLRELDEARGGTLFLEEVADVGLKVQAQLLRAMQDKVDVRIVAASSKDLKALSKDGAFREDLLYRLDVVRLHLPPLRERAEDVTALVEHFAAMHARGGARPVVTREAMERLVAYEWPGNVRQLENVVARALALNATGVLGPGDFPHPIGDAGPTKVTGLSDDLPTLDLLSRRYATQVLQHTGGNKSEAARILDVDRKTLYRLIGPCE